jgi:molybdopterin synthase sulfur carrier subunit
MIEAWFLAMTRVEEKAMRVRVYGTLRAVMGGVKETEAQVSEPCTAGDILQQLVAAYPGLREKVFRGKNELIGGVGLFVNGRSTRFLQGLDTPVRHGDELALFPPIGGG